MRFSPLTWTLIAGGTAATGGVAFWLWKRSNAPLAPLVVPPPSSTTTRSAVNFPLPTMTVVPGSAPIPTKSSATPFSSLYRNLGRQVPNPTPASSPDPAAPPSSLLSGQSLYEGDVLVSPDGRGQLSLTNGFLEFRRTIDGALLPPTTMYGRGRGGQEQPAVQATLQSVDGNLVLFNAANQPVWASGTQSLGPGAHLDVQWDGNLVILGLNGRPYWATNSVGFYTWNQSDFDAYFKKYGSDQEL